MKAIHSKTSKKGHELPCNNFEVINNNNNYDAFTLANAFQMISMYHNDTLGHHDEQITQSLMQAKGLIWPTITNDIKLYISKCYSCHCNRATIKTINIEYFDVFLDCCAEDALISFSDSLSC